ncbi:MAG TPA: NlpC/P60 family protein [Rubrobacter sp.]|nr:NlpC/P60 family protein [Rubrobacter sp.]
MSTAFVLTGVVVALSSFVVSAGALSAQRDAGTPATAQYSTEAHTHVDSSQEVSPTHFEVATTADTSYYDFYARWLAQDDDFPGVSEEEASAEGTTVESAPPESAPSEGSDPGSHAPAEARAIMEPSTPYSQVVDNASSRRFYSERNWRESSHREASRYRKDFTYTRPAKDGSPAWFRVKIPSDGYYTVYARWPAARINNTETRFRISTVSGLEKVEVNQRRDGGVWVRLGAYEMKESNRYSVQVAGRSKAEGRIVADAVMVVAGTQAAPQPGEDGAARRPAVEEATPTGGNVTASEVVARARTHLGTPYRHSPPLPCEAYRSEDCSCLTSLVFSKWITMTDNPVEQWKVGRSVQRSDLRPGDLVFFKEAGDGYPITHVAIYSGAGNIIHASTYWSSVVERPMKYVDGYYGARRL